MVLKKKKRGSDCEETTIGDGFRIHACRREFNPHSARERLGNLAKNEKVKMEELLLYILKWKLELSEEMK